MSIPFIQTNNTAVEATETEQMITESNRYQDNMIRRALTVKNSFATQLQTGVMFARPSKAVKQLLADWLGLANKFRSQGGLAEDSIIGNNNLKIKQFKTATNQSNFALTTAVRTFSNTSNTNI